MIGELGFSEPLVVHIVLAVEGGNGRGVEVRGKARDDLLVRALEGGIGLLDVDAETDPAKEEAAAEKKPAKKTSSKASKTR